MNHQDTVFACIDGLATTHAVVDGAFWAAERLHSMTPAGHEAVIHVSLTDDHPWAQAFVVIEARPLAPGGTGRA